MEGLYVWFLILVTSVNSAPQLKKEGDSCTLENGKPGICKKFSQCPSAMEDFASTKWSLQRCGTRPTPICCGDFTPADIAPTTTAKMIKTPSTTTTTTTVATTTTTEATTTAASPPEKSTPPYGWKSKQKCEEYSRWLTPRVLLLDSHRVPGICGISIEPTIVGGISAAPLEFPHMAKLSYANPDLTCAGSLISEEFLLTAAHCLKGKNGPLMAKLGTADSKSQKTIKIVEQIKHPDYADPLKYNDIALLRLEEPLKEFTDYMRPACVQTETDINKTFAFASGWGTTEFKGKASDALLKVSLPFVNQSDCKKHYRRDFNLQTGVDEETMICAGGINLKRDTCQGDSGGPLQYGQREPSCMYSIVGITSFGSNCGTVPGVYTRVSNFVPWIESIVWPDEDKKTAENDMKNFYFWY